MALIGRKQRLTSAGALVVIFVDYYGSLSVAAVCWLIVLMAGWCVDPALMGGVWAAEVIIASACVPVLVHSGGGAQISGTRREDRSLWSRLGRSRLGRFAGKFTVSFLWRLVRVLTAPLQSPLCAGLVGWMTAAVC